MEERDVAVREHVRENVLVPLMKMMPRVIKGLKEFNIHFPIQKIAYLEMHGDLVVEGLEGFREELTKSGRSLGLLRLRLLSFLSNKFSSSGSQTRNFTVYSGIQKRSFLISYPT